MFIINSKWWAAWAPGTKFCSFCDWGYQRLITQIKLYLNYYIHFMMVLQCMNPRKKVRYKNSILYIYYKYYTKIEVLCYSVKKKPKNTNKQSGLKSLAELLKIFQYIWDYSFRCIIALQSRETWAQACCWYASEQDLPLGR